MAVVPPPAGRDHDGRGPSQPARFMGARAARAYWLQGQTPQSGTDGRDEGSPRTGSNHKLAITCLSPGRFLLRRLTAVSVVARIRRQMLTVRLQGSLCP